VDEQRRRPAAGAIDRQQELAVHVLPVDGDADVGYAARRTSLRTRV
jgi:hypothetical protein